MKQKRMLLILLLFVLFLSACNQNEEHPNVQNIEGMDDFPYHPYAQSAEGFDDFPYEDFPYEFKLPTHMPYEVEGVRFNYNQSTVKLPKNINELKPMDFSLLVSLIGNLKDNEVIKIEIYPEREYRKQLKLSNGIEAEYNNDGNVQKLTWNGAGLNYTITVNLPEQDNELYSVEELIKIADSFAPYYRPE